ncbi:MAG: FAD-dependent oxidoreductase [Patescibacteria group bacterium]|mgnify:CR=1 FL=1
MIYDLIIIGGGPAGIAAGVYAARKKLKTLLIAESFGGQSVIATQINNFIGFKSISGIELKNVLESHLRDQKGIEIKEGGKISKIEKSAGGFLIFIGEAMPDGRQEYFESKTLLIALGSGHKRLNVSGEKEFEGKGVFYCSICDAPLMSGKTVAVVGGGNSGLYAVLDLIPYAEKIYVLEYSDVFRADPIYIDKAKESGKVEFIAMAKILEITGDRFVSNIKYEDRNSGEIKELKIGGVFVAIGYAPNSGLVNGLVEINQNGKIIIDHQTQKTSLEGVWAAGDITDVLYGQINIAIGDAVKAVLNINDYLKKK